jgi:hypothetical protein
MFDVDKPYIKISLIPILVYVRSTLRLMHGTSVEFLGIDHVMFQNSNP